MQRLLRKPVASVLYHAAIFAVVSLCVFVLFHFGMDSALAQTQTAFERFGDASTLPQESIVIIIARIIRVALSIIGIIFVCLVVYAGFLWMTAAGRPEPIEKAKKILKQGIIGLFLILASYSITTFILNALLDAAYESGSSSAADSYTEPLSGALGGGILDDHYPARNAVDIPRNTKIFVTFKEPIELDSIIQDYVDDSTTDLNTTSVLIYRTEDGAAEALGAEDVVVSFDDDHEIFVFDPVEYMGSADADTNYTIGLTSNITTEDGESAFSGAYSGYEWTFEVSTEIDLTPPTVTFTIPQEDDEEPMNVSVELTFSEAMDPVVATGTYYPDADEFFTIISVQDSEGNIVEGTYEMSNAYRTVTFTTFDACGEDPCGDTIYCLPGNEELLVTAAAASVDEAEIPQSRYAFADGLVDAAANVLDGDNDYDADIDGTACGSDTDLVDCSDLGDNDDYVFDFTTTNELEDTVPAIVSLHPDISDDEIDQSEPVAAVFNTYLKGSTLNTDHVSLWPDPMYEMWFTVRKADSIVPDVTPDGCGDLLTGSCLQLAHPTFVANDVGGWDYYPLFNQGVKSSYQICMFPSIGEETSCSEEGRENTPYCCNGSPDMDGCTTVITGSELDVYDNPPDDE
jgi:hypothetical protein